MNDVIVTEENIEVVVPKIETYQSVGIEDFQTSLAYGVCVGVGIGLLVFGLSVAFHMFKAATSI